jgi:hypothetical protein
MTLEYRLRPQKRRGVRTARNRPAPTRWQSCRRRTGSFRKRDIFKHFLSIGDAIRILTMMYNNPATSGVDMSPELLVRMFETIDNLTMVKGSTGWPFPDAARRPAQRRPAAFLRRR